MVRSRSSSYARLGPSLAVLAMVAWACGGAQEEAQVRQFFRASQLSDTQTLANFATVSFDPRTDGIVQSFEITSVSEERTTPLRLKELAEAHEEARAADAEFSKRKKAYQDANMEAIERVLKAERENKKLTGKDLAVQTDWSKWREETAQSAKRVSEARTRLNDERPIAGLSLETPRNPVDPSTVDGSMATKDVTVSAQVRMPDGQVAQKTLILTMQRAVGKADGKDVAGRWIITAVKDASGATKTS